jgi:hypothetical protein
MLRVLKAWLFRRENGSNEESCGGARREAETADSKAIAAAVDPEVCPHTLTASVSGITRCQQRGYQTQATGQRNGVNRAQVGSVDLSRSAKLDPAGFHRDAYGWTVLPGRSPVKENSAVEVQ